MIFLSLLFIEIQAFDGISCSCSELELEQECQYAGCEWITNTNQCINRLPINQPNCSDYEDQLVCDFLQGCAWNNQGKCEQFTQCSDYVIDQYDTSDQCYLKDQTCRNGQINNQGFITCQSIDQFCNDYANELMTIKLENQTSMIAQNIENQTQIVDLKYKIQNTCIQQQTIINECSMITNEIICKFIKNKYQTIICEWQNDQCIQSTNKPQLNSQQCYLQTGGTYSWNDNKCQICEGNQVNQRILQQSIHQPISSTSIKTYKKQVSESIANMPNPTSIDKCNTSVNKFETSLCFTEGCQKVYAEKMQNICQQFTGVNLDQLSQESQFNSVCNYDENRTSIQNLTEYNSILNCLDTIIIIPYKNGTKQTPITQDLQKNFNCTKQIVINQINDWNSIKNCQELHILLINNHSLAFNDTYNTLTQEQTQPNGNDPLTEETFSSQGTQTHNYGGLPKEDYSFFSIKYYTPFQSNYSSQLSFINVENKMVQVFELSNSTTEIIILNLTDSFKNTTKNIFTKGYIESFKDNNLTTISKSNQTDNVTLIEEIRTRIYKSP